MTPIMSLDLSRYQQIASATSDRPGQMRWTAIAIYYRPASFAETFVAVVIGGTRIEGEETRESRTTGASVREATRNLQNSTLAGEALAQAADWLEQHPGREAEAVRATYGVDPRIPAAVTLCNAADNAWRRLRGEKLNPAAGAAVELLREATLNYSNAEVQAHEL